MSWSGTVYCGYCRGKGHNRRGCEQYKKDMKDRYDRAKQTPEGERSHYDTIAIDRWENQQQKKSAPRRCTYCSDLGHNRRTCDKLKVHMEHILKQEFAFRKAFVEHINEIGLNVGCLIMPHGDNTRKQIRNVPHLVTGIRWEEITIVSARESFNRFVMARPVTDLVSDRQLTGFNIHPPEHWPTGAQWVPMASRWQEQYYGLQVVSGTPGSIEPPAGWLENTSDVKDFFKDRESWQWPSENNVSDYYKCDWWLLEENQELEESA